MNNIFVGIIMVLAVIAGLTFSVGVLALGIGVLMMWFSSITDDQIEGCHEPTVRINYDERMNDSLDRIVDGYDEMIQLFKKMAETCCQDEESEDTDEELEETIL